MMMCHLTGGIPELSRTVAYFKTSDQPMYVRMLFDVICFALYCPSSPQIK